MSCTYVGMMYELVAIPDPPLLRVTRATRKRGAIHLPAYKTVLSSLHTRVRYGQMVNHQDKTIYTHVGAVNHYHKEDVLSLET